MSLRPTFSKPLPLTALLPQFVACGPSDGGITVDEDDTTSTGSRTSGSSSAGTTSSVAGTGGGSTSGVTSGTGGSSTSGAGVGDSDPTGGGDTTLIGVETPGADCFVPNMPASSELKVYGKLHDPFTIQAPGAPFSYLSLRVLGLTANESHRAPKLLVHVPLACHSANSRA
jgi:hypothetical protein